MPVKINGSSSGSVTLAAPASGSDVTLTLPGAAGTVALTNGNTYTGTHNFSGATVVEPAGRILQVVNATYATAVTTTSSSYVTTNLTATITPSSASSKIMVIATNPMRINTINQSVDIKVFRGTVAGTAIGPHITLENSAGAVNAGVTIAVLDSPATTSAQIYTMGFAVSGGTGTAQVGNRASEIILMEVSA